MICVIHLDHVNNELINKVSQRYVKFPLLQGDLPQGISLPLLQFHPYCIEAFQEQLQNLKNPLLIFDIL